MIKTVSFAPPRSARAAAKPAGKSASKPAKAQPAREIPRETAVAPSVAALAQRPAKTQSARVTSGSSPIPHAEENFIMPHRRAAKTSDLTLDFETESAAIAPTVVAAKAATPKKTRAVEVATALAPAAIAAVEIEAEVVTSKKTRAVKTAPAPAAPATAATAPAPVAPPAKTLVKARAARAVKVAEIVAPIESEAVDVAPVETESAPEKALIETKIAPKIKRSRAPKDLALQYGGAATEEISRPVAEKVAPRKRLTREAKAARSQMLRPDDNVLQRLQQANAIEVKKPANRGRGWEFECGCCGRISRFQTPAAICECGAIAVKE